MAEGRIGTQIGLFRRATIRKYNENGTVVIALNDPSLDSAPKQFTVPLSLPWTGPGGEFIGGYPRVGSSVIVSQGEGGQWFIVSYIPSNTVFDSFSITADSTLMSALKPGRALMQVRGGTRVLIDPKEGIQAGQDDNFIHINPDRNILSHNFGMELGFTEAGRYVDGIIKRDLVENSNRNILGSTLDSQSYDSSLFSIALDPSTAVYPTTTGSNVRNPPLVERREMVYEFANSFEFTTDEDEAARYTDPKAGKRKIRTSRRDNRADVLSLSSQAPNQLFESIMGTVVDTFGNVLDINRAPLPVGKIDNLSLRKNSDKEDGFIRLRGQYRKSIAFHWEQNSRKGTSDSAVSTVRDVASKKDYARDASNFFFDLDKEGQFKLNVPASSETGNISLLTRYENYSVLRAKEANAVDPNSFLRSENSQDIFLENFAGKPSILLSGSDKTLDGYASPIDRNTDAPIKLGTAYHDITTTISEFTTNANSYGTHAKLIDFDKNHHLNTDFVPLEKLVTDTLIVSGPDANAGGRSGTMNFDGMLSISVGANTVDRQSLWLDTAGGVIYNIGRDKNNISCAAGLDGDFLMQIGGPGIGNTYDSRFADENDAYRNGTAEIRVHLNGQLMIFRMGPTGIDIVSPGSITMSCQQNFILRSNSSMIFEAENIVMHGETSKRIVNKFPATTI